MICAVDTCFLIDWARYSKRDILEKLFDYCFVTEDLLNEVKTEITLTYVATLLAKGFLVFYPFKHELDPLVRQLIDISIRDPRIRVLDPPEAYALAIGIREGATVLSENRGVIGIVRYYPQYSSVIVWRSYELLLEAYRRGVIENFEKELQRYENETGHRFPRILRRRGKQDRA